MTETGVVRYVGADFGFISRTGGPSSVFFRAEDVITLDAHGAPVQLVRKDTVRFVFLAATSATSKCRAVAV